ncbi:MAG TPA: MFS transporter [Candidatus Limnocylindrales bacterium]|nr:MFS transporter [Candidatus Limnocylindrales bacterium]
MAAMSHKSWALLAAILGSGIVFLDSSVVVVAQKAIGEDLPSSFFARLEALNYVYYGYLLTLSALLVLAGALNDFYGRRRVFALGLAGFGATSALCGLAPNMELLIVARMAQGAAGALLVPGSLSILTATFEGEERSRAFGIWAGASGVAAVVGPIVGGLLVNIASWRLVFLINVPLVAMALWATWRHLRESRDEHASGAFDWLGAAVVALAVGGLSFGVIRGQSRDWRDPLAFAALAVGAACAIALPLLMARRPHPLVPLELFRSRNFSVTNLSTLLIYGALYVQLQYQALFLIGVLGYDEVAYTLATLPSSACLVFGSTWFGRLAARHGPRRFMAAGPAIMALGILWFARFPRESGAWPLRAPLERLLSGEPGASLAAAAPPLGFWIDFLPGSLLFGIGLMVMVAPLTTALMTSVPVRNSGVASAVNNAVSRVGPQLVGAVVFVAITATFYGQLAARLPGVDVTRPEVRASLPPMSPPAPGVAPDEARAARDASTDAFRLAMVIAAGFLAAGALVNAVGIRDQATPVEDVGASPSPSSGS